MSEQSLHKEIEIRGAALRLSITIEMVLMSIVYFSNGKQYKEQKAKTLLLKGLMFSQKIARVREVLAENTLHFLTTWKLLKNLETR